MSDVPTSSATGATPGVFIDPYRDFNWKLLVPGLAEAHFTECLGWAARVNPISYYEGGTTQVHRIPGRVEYAEVTLRYGLTKSRQLWDWFLTGIAGKVQRQNVSIVMLEPDGSTPAIQWDLIRAWVSEWRGAPLDAAGTEVAIESLVLVYEDLKRGT